MDFLMFLIVGGVIGWIASLVMKTNAQMGLIANVVVGAVGSILGFWIAGVLGLTAGGPVVGWLIAIAGAVLLILILRMLKIVK